MPRRAPASSTDARPQRDRAVERRSRTARRDRPAQTPDAARARPPEPRVLRRVADASQPQVAVEPGGHRAKRAQRLRECALTRRHHAEVLLAPAAALGRRITDAARDEAFVL